MQVRAPDRTHVLQVNVRTAVDLGACGDETLQITQMLGHNGSFLESHAALQIVLSLASLMPTLPWTASVSSSRPSRIIVLNEWTQLEFTWMIMQQQ